MSTVSPLLAVVAAALAPFLAACARDADPCADWQTGLVPQTVVVVMDATDGLSRPQREDMWSRIRPVADQAPAGSVFHLFEVRSEASGGVRELGTIRRPPHPCEVNHWSDNPDQRAAQWAPRYLRPLRDALGAMSRAAPSDSSAILQALSAAARAFGESPDSEGRLILVSDLLQNVGVDFYRGSPISADSAMAPSIARYAPGGSPGSGSTCSSFLRAARGWSMKRRSGVFGPRISPTRECWRWRPPSSRWKAPAHRTP